MNSKKVRTEHCLKSWPPFFQAIVSDAKRHDIRRCDDRRFCLGDVLLLQEYDPVRAQYTGREARVVITYITSIEYPCALSSEALDKNFCILSIRLLGECTR